MTNSTFSDNVGLLGGAIFNNPNAPGGAGTTKLSNTIVANSTPNLNCDGPITDDGYNISSDGSCVSASTSKSKTDPKLGPNGLQDNGGPTQTIALESGSPAIDQGNSFGVNTDQRGRPRPVDDPATTNAPGGDGSDVGAYEAVPNNPPPPPPPPPPPGHHQHHHHQHHHKHHGGGSGGNHHKKHHGGNSSGGGGGGGGVIQ